MFTGDSILPDTMKSTLWHTPPAAGMGEGGRMVILAVSIPSTRATLVRKSYLGEKKKKKYICIDEIQIGDLSAFIIRNTLIEVMKTRN